MTTILWDIDGPLNPQFATDLVERKFLHVNEGYASWNIDVINHGQWMRHLEKLTTMVWCSAWLNDSNVLATYYMLENHMDFVDLYDSIEPGTNPDEGMWKLPAVKEYLHKSVEPIIWLDDEFTPDAFQWAENRGNTLLILCDPAIGWTYEQYQQMLEFIELHK